MKRLFYNLFTSKDEKFAHALASVERDGTILEVDPDGKWFAAVVHYKLDEIRGNEGASAPNLVLVRKKDLRQVTHMRLVIDMEKSELLLGDFESRIENKGYGSILLRNLIKLAELLEINTITGNLSAVDSGGFDKLNYLYSKYGFEVSIKGNSGTIIRRMK